MIKLRQNLPRRLVRYVVLSLLLRHVQCESKKLPLWGFPIFSQRLRILAEFYTPIVCSYLYGKLQNFIQLSLNLTKVCHIKCNHPMNFHFSLYRLYRKEFWWIWPPNSSGLSPLDYHVWSAMHQVFWTQTSLKAQDHSGAKNCTAADLRQLDADNDFVNVWTHAPRPVVDILNIWLELYTEIFWLNS